LRFCRLFGVSLFRILPPPDVKERDDEEGPGLLGGFADIPVVMKLLHLRVEDPVDEQDDVVDAAQSMLIFVPCPVPESYN
jgi:hypothetical protein